MAPSTHTHTHTHTHTFQVSSAMNGSELYWVGQLVNSNDEGRGGDGGDGNSGSGGGAKIRDESSSSNLAGASTNAEPARNKSMFDELSGTIAGAHFNNPVVPLKV